MQHVFRASVLTVLLCSCISLHHSGAAQRQGSSTQPSLSQPCHVTAHLEGQTELHRCRAPITSWCLEARLALPGRCKAVPGNVSYQLGATGRFATAYWEASLSVFLSFLEWHQPQTSVFHSFSPCLIIARQFSLSGLHLWYPWNVWPSCAAVTRCWFLLKLAILKSLLKKAAWRFSGSFDRSEKTYSCSHKRLAIIWSVT